MEEYELDAVISELEEVQGGGTWHVSLYIRPDKSLQSMSNRLGQEMSEAEAIKSDSTRDRVQSSLQKIRDALSNYRRTPENGLVVFASPKDVHILDDLPFECPDNRYHCGKEFLLEPLQSGFDTGGTYGLIVVERGRAAIGVLNSGRIEGVLEKESQVMGKTKAGGQSQARFERLRENQKHEFFKSVQESAYASWKPYTLDGVVIGGTLDTAKEFEGSYTNHDWRVLGTYSVDHGDKQGLEELVERARDRLLDEDRAEVREMVESFLHGLRDGSAAYGRDDVDEKLGRGRVDTVLISENVDVNEIRDWFEYAEQYGSEVALVPITFEQAEMFENMSGGYGAILRW